MVNKETDTAQGQSEATGSKKTGKGRANRITVEELFTPEMYRLLEILLNEQNKI